MGDRLWKLIIIEGPHFSALNISSRRANHKVTGDINVTRNVTVLLDVENDVMRQTATLTMSTTMSDGGGDRSGDGDSNSNGDDNPRPHKRIRSSIDDHRAHLPAPHLLLSLPALLIHPPSHPHHPHSLHLSLVALRKCLTLKALTPDLECRAWSALAEVGFRVVGGGFSTSADHMWANGVDTEVEKAIGKGVRIHTDFISF